MCIVPRDRGNKAKPFAFCFAVVIIKCSKILCDIKTISTMKISTKGKEGRQRGNKVGKLKIVLDY